MDTYLVGGAVRDELMGAPVSDRDWLCIGASPSQMLAAGYAQVGREFAVFLDPITHEEHALPRPSRAPAVAGVDPDLASDLWARDLTINAMAMDGQGQLIDPWGGQADLERRVLRHTSEAFAEDPLRILRVARFRARFSEPAFEVAPETLDLMRRMVEEGALSHIPPERIWKEVSRALMTSRPSRFFETLREVGALKKLMPEIDRLFGVPQNPVHHPEVDTGIHVMMCIDVAAAEEAPLPVRVATLLHDLGKGATPREEWPRHIGHESAGVPLVQHLCNRLRVPHDLRDLAVAVSEDHLRVHRAIEMRPSSVVDLLTSLHAYRKREFFTHALWACRCDARGRTGMQDKAYPQTDHLMRALELTSTVQAQDVMARGVQGPDIPAAMRDLRCQLLSQVLRPRQSSSAPPVAAMAPTQG